MTNMRILVAALIATGVDAFGVAVSECGPGMETGIDAFGNVDEGCYNPVSLGAELRFAINIEYYHGFMGSDAAIPTGFTADGDNYIKTVPLTDNNYQLTADGKDIELVHTEVFTPDAINNVIFEQPREHQFKCFYNIEDKEMIIETAVFNVEGEDEDLGMREWPETSRNGSFIKYHSG